MKSTGHLFFMLVVLAFSIETVQAIPLESWDSKINTTKRFVVLADFNGEAVLDKETGRP